MPFPAIRPAACLGADSAQTQRPRGKLMLMTRPRRAAVSHQTIRMHKPTLPPRQWGFCRWCRAPSCCLAAKHCLPPGLRLLGASHFPNSQLLNAKCGFGQAPSDAGASTPVKPVCHAPVIAWPWLLPSKSTRPACDNKPARQNGLCQKKKSCPRFKEHQRSQKAAQACQSKHHAIPPKHTPLKMHLLRAHGLCTDLRAIAIHMTHSHCHASTNSRLAWQSSTCMPASAPLKDVPKTNRSPAFHANYAFFKKEGFPVSIRNSRPYGSTLFN